MPAVSMSVLPTPMVPVMAPTPAVKERAAHVADIDIAIQRQRPGSINGEVVRASNHAGEVNHSTRQSDGAAQRDAAPARAVQSQIAHAQRDIIVERDHAHAGRPDGESIHAVVRLGNRAAERNGRAIKRDVAVQHNAAAGQRDVAGRHVVARARDIAPQRQHAASGGERDSTHHIASNVCVQWSARRLQR